jgi:hypothetical protein
VFRPKYKDAKPKGKYVNELKIINNFFYLCGKIIFCKIVIGLLTLNGKFVIIG